MNIFSVHTMKETSFIDQNKQKWHKFQQLAANDSADPEELSDLYSDITDDLSYAQTFYSKRTVRVYLNQLAQGIHNLVHQERSESLKKLFTVWKTSIPLEIYRARKNMLFALILSCIWILIGSISTIKNPEFANVVLGDYYISITNENIAKGNPLDIYQDQTQVKMFFDITLNNIRVAFMSFIFGILFGIGTHIMLMKNAVMVGVFQSYFYVKGFLYVAFLTIWIHGAFEISSLVIAGGAGITLGNGILFPGSYTRMQSLQFAAKRGLKIMMSLIPFFIVAGFLESYVTHNYGVLSQWSKWVLIFFCFAIILFYFVIYPLIVARRNPHLIYENEPPIKNFTNTFSLVKMRTFGQLFAESFSYYRVHIGKIFKANLLVSGPIIIAVLIMQNTERYDDLLAQHTYDWSYLLNLITGTDPGYKGNWLAMFGWSIVAAQIITTACYGFVHQHEEFSWRKMIRFNYTKLPIVYLGSILLLLIIFLVPWYLCLFLIFLVPLFIMTSVTPALDEEKIGRRFLNGFRFSIRSYGTILLTILLFSFIIFLFAQLIAGVYSYQDNYWVREPAMPDLLDMLSSFVSYISRHYTENHIVPGNITREIVYILFILFTMPLFVIMLGFNFYTVREQETAYGLKKEFEKFGKRKRNQETKIDFD